MLVKTLKAKIDHGFIKPLEKLNIKDGREIYITILAISEKTKKDVFKEAAGAWAKTVDCKKLITY